MPARTTGLQFRGSFSGLLLRGPSRDAAVKGFCYLRDPLRDALLDPFRAQGSFEGDPKP